MAAPTMDPNSWYSLSIAGDSSTLLMSTNLFSRSGTAGATFFASTAPDNSTQRWQVFPLNTTTFVLRTQEGGANAFIGSQPADKNGRIAPLMLRGDVADESVFWTIGGWGDGTWFLSNGGNGSAYHLARNQTGVVMDANVTAPQNEQRWGFEKGKEIDDERYSSVNLLGASLTASTPASPTPSSTAVSTSASASASASASTSAPADPSASTSPSPSSTPSSSSGLSTPAKAGIGAAIGIAALIALVVLGLFLRRRRARKQAATAAQDTAYEPYHVAPYQDASGMPGQRGEEEVKHELDHGGEGYKYELPQPTVVEVDARGQERPAELMGDVGRRS